MSSSDSFAANWVPTLNGVAVAGTPLIENLRDVRPNPANPEEREWSKPSNKKYLEAHPESAEAIFGAILMLWRLQRVQEEANFDQSWADNVVAWTVSLLEVGMWFSC